MPLRFDDPERRAAQTLIDLALVEDLQTAGDLTCQALIDPQARGEVAIVSRETGRLAGLPIVDLVFVTLDPSVEISRHAADGDRLHAGTLVATLSGPLRSLLIGERTVLNFLTHLSSIATLTRRFVEAVAGTGAVILDTRKTFPGYRMLQKYAVRAGGGTNHRMGLYDGILIKDNHLAFWAESGGSPSVADAVRQARRSAPAGIRVEVEVDTLDQLASALEANPGIVLLDNLDLEQMRRAVAMRDQRSPGTLLEASGGVNLETVRGIAETGVERISVGALTHSATALDLGFDWRKRTT